VSCLFMNGGGRVYIGVTDQRRKAISTAANTRAG
jgi:hypothetical protein